MRSGAIEYTSSSRKMLRLTAELAFDHQLAQRAFFAPWSIAPSRWKPPSMLTRYTKSPLKLAVVP